MAAFEEMRQKGLKVKQYWFKAPSCQLMKELHPDVDFRFSQGWFDMFKSRNKISYCRATNIAQKTPTDYEEMIQKFHQSIRRIAASDGSKSGLGKFSLSTIANVDQTPYHLHSIRGRDTIRKVQKLCGTREHSLVWRRDSVLCN